MREVEIEGSLRDAGRLRDLFDGGLVDAVVEAAFGPEREGGVDQCPSRAARALLDEPGPAGTARGAVLVH